MPDNYVIPLCVCFSTFWGRGQVCIHLNLPRPHLQVGYTGFVFYLQTEKLKGLCCPIYWLSLCRVWGLGIFWYGHCILHSICYWYFIVVVHDFSITFFSVILWAPGLQCLLPCIFFFSFRFSYFMSYECIIAKWKYLKTWLLFYAFYFTF